MLVDVIRTVEDIRRKWRDPKLRLIHAVETVIQQEIIEPLLEALGWEVGEQGTCRRNWRVDYGNGLADYACFIGKEGINGIQETKLTVLIEVKRPAVALVQDADRARRRIPFEQLADYVNDSRPMENGVTVLTDGSDWQFYEVDPSWGIEYGEYETVCVDVAGGDVEDVASRLVSWLGRTRWD